MWDFSSLTGDQTRVPCIARQILNRWTNREVPQCHSHKPYFYLFCSCSLRPSESKLTGPGYQSADPRLGPYILKGHHLYYYSEGISRQAWTEIGAAGKRCRFPGNRVSCGSGASGWATFLVTVLEVVTVKSWESHTCVFPALCTCQVHRTHLCAGIALPDALGCTDEQDVVRALRAQGGQCP